MYTFLSYFNQIMSIAIAAAILFCFVSIIIRAVKLKKQTKKLGLDQISTVSIIFSILAFIAFYIMLYAVKEQTELTYNLLSAISFIATGALVLFVLRTIYLVMKKSPLVDQKIGVLTFWILAIFAIYTVVTPAISQIASMVTPSDSQIVTPPTPTEETSVQAQ